MSDEKQSTAIAKTTAEPAPLPIVPIAASYAIQLTPETVRRFINRFATEQEIALFLNQAAMFQLNPLKRELYLIKYSEREPATFVTGYEVYLKRAERTGKWNGLETGHEEGPNGIPVKAWARVGRKDWPTPLYHEVFYREYVQTAKDKETGKPYVTKFWREKPITMLKKVAVAQALRMAFPDEFAGLPYIEEEIHSEDLPGSEGPAGAISKILEPLKDEIAEKKAREKAEYEALKKKPLPRIRDEFDPEAPAADVKTLEPQGGSQDQASPKPDPSVDIYAEAEAAAAGEKQPERKGPGLALLEKFGKIKADLGLLGLNEVTMWAGIQRFSLNTLKLPAVDTQDFDGPQMEAVLGYLHRWKKALEKEAEAKKERTDGKK